MSPLWCPKPFKNKLCLFNMTIFTGSSEIENISGCIKKIWFSYFFLHLFIFSSSSNFLKIHIYFEDLNYELITEEPLYDVSLQFIPRDSGGEWVEVMAIIHGYCISELKAKYHFNWFVPRSLAVCISWYGLPYQ